MKLNSISSFAGIFILAASISLSAQEYIMPLGDNPLLVRKEFQSVKKNVQDVVLEIPVEDDFHLLSPYPDPKIWADNYAFINDGYAINPPSLGVATLDALDADGSVYPFASISPETFDADYLSSHPINLDYPASDSIYLSFYYQPQGNGLEPRSYDSLCLDFYDIVDSIWINVWRVPGDTLRDFEQVMIPIEDERYLKDGFRFSFRNKASLPQNKDYKDKRGNVDHWNIDYVRLDRNRNYRDTVIRDVAVYKPLPSMLKNYESIPWDHFEIGYNTIYLPYISLNYFNNDTSVRNVTRSMEIYDEVWNETFKPSNASAQDIFPGAASSYDIANFYPFNFSRGDTARYRIKAWLRTDDFDNKANDTIYKIQRFRDYFAYDDGTAERAYGLRGQGTNNGLIAVRFNSFIADELGGVDVYFSQLKDSINLDYYFRFMVWDDFEGMPGELIYEDDIDHAADYSETINEFRRYYFKQTVPVQGTFYVGILQYNQFLLNIGMDINKPPNGNLLYNLGSDWLQSAAPGTLMLRPFVQRSYSTATSPSINLLDLKVYPNPANDYIRIDIPENADLNDIEIILYDITGKQLAFQNKFDQELYTGDLPEGIYLLSIKSSSQFYKTQKFIIQR